MMKQKKFMDIVRVKETDTELAVANIGGFEPGDFIVIQEKVDGANASIRYDEETGKLLAFSRKRELRFDLTLNGFWNYVQLLDVLPFQKNPNYVVFGEWLLKNAIHYHPDAYSKWYLYDIYDMDKEQYLPQEMVKEFCKQYGFIYVNTFYEGPFVSWDHCKSFVGQSDIAENQGEGVVIKNQTKLNSPAEKLPFVLKIVGEHFTEIKKSNHIEKIRDPQKVEARAKAMEITESIVTRRRVEKELYKMRDEGILPDNLEPQNMREVAQNLPRRIYEDCVKEESEVVKMAGEYFGKLSGVVAMRYAREMVMGHDVQ